MPEHELLGVAQKIHFGFRVSSFDYQILDPNEWAHFSMLWSLKQNETLIETILENAIWNKENSAPKYLQIVFNSGL